jgi:O-antigen ligase
LIEIGGHLVAVFMPLYINPFAHQSIELDKFQFLLWVTLGMLLVALAAFILGLGKNKNWQNISGILGKTIKSLRADNPLFLPVLVYAAIYILAAVFSIDPGNSWWGLNTAQGTATVMCCILFFILLASAIKEKSQINRLVTSLIVGSVPVSIYGWVQFLGFDPLDWVSGSISQVHATLGYSLFLGSYLVLIIPFSISRLIAGLNGLRYPIWGYGIILFLQTSCLLFTLARGAWLGITLGGFVLVILLAIHWRKRRLLLVSSGLVVIGGILFILLNTGFPLSLSSSFEWVSSTRILEARAISNNERMVLWRLTLPMISSRPWLGYGPESFSSAYSINYPEDSPATGLGIDPWVPHNWFLYHLTAVGIIGFIAFIWVQVKFFYESVTALRKTKVQDLQLTAAAIIGTGAAYLIQAQFNPIAITPAAIYWFILAMAAALSSQKLHALENASSVALEG